MSTQRYTPNVKQLLPDYFVVCQQPNCAAIFRNAGNYDMHLQKCHKLTGIAKRCYQQFHCPHSGCVYHVDYAGDGKSFTTLKYLRQHYRKVHCHKGHACTRCTKKFATAGLLRSHTRNECGKTFACLDCSAQYDNLSALQVHAKRRAHNLPTERNTKGGPKADTPKGDVHRSTQTEGQRDASVQTESQMPTPTNTVATLTLPEDVDDLQVYLRDIETQADVDVDFHSLPDWTLDNMAALGPPHKSEEPTVGTAVSKYHTGCGKADHGCACSNAVCEAGVQTETGVVGVGASSIPTHNVATITVPEDFDDLHMILRNMETQTETGAEAPRKMASTNSVATTTVPDFYDLQLLLRNTQHTQTELSPTADAKSGFFDEMLGGRATSMAAQQTCGDEDFLSEFGLVHMQTQTNVSCGEWMAESAMATATATKSTSCAHDVLLVSTETQTSFAQCLLDYGAAHTGDPYTTTTQYTQTGDNLLESLFDDPEESDAYIGEFQSSYTQT